MEFQILSDIHLEFYDDGVFYDLATGNIMIGKRILLRPVAPILILAGDIGKPGKPIYENFMGLVSNLFEQVFYVPGNHEYYGGTIEEGNKKMPNADKVTCLVEEGVVIYGVTLWTKIAVSDIHECMKRIADYTHIKKLEDRRKVHIDTVDTDELHEEQLNGIKEMIAKCKENEWKLVLVTHHAPLLECNHPEYLDKGAGFCNDLSEMLDECGCGSGGPVIAWVYGHTHYNMDFEYNGVRVISNQFGYPDEKQVGVPFSYKKCILGKSSNA